MNQEVRPLSLSTTNFLQPIIEKLNDKNFFLWKHEPAITAIGLNSFVATPQIPPRYLSGADRDLDNVNPQFSLWQKQDKFLLVWLQSTLSSSSAWIDALVSGLG